MMRLKLSAFRSAVRFIFVLLVVSSSCQKAAFSAASSWAAGQKAQARLVSGGTLKDADGLFIPEGARLAFIEIVLEPGWKTYWRTPGDAGGLPPSFDWSNSSNLARAEVMYPAPRRFTDKAGNTIGYDGELVLPVALLPVRDDEPISLSLHLEYGICKDVCIPVESLLSLEIAADETAPASESGLRALRAVPRAQENLRPSDPELVSVAGTLGGDSPCITIEARFPEGDETADVFLEAPNGHYLPLPELKERKENGNLVFEARLDEDVDLALLQGKAITATLVSEAGASVATFLVK